MRTNVGCASVRYMSANRVGASCTDVNHASTDRTSMKDGSLTYMYRRRNGSMRAIPHTHAVAAAIAVAVLILVEITVATVPAVAIATTATAATTSTLAYCVRGQAAARMRDYAGLAACGHTKTHGRKCAPRVVDKFICKESCLGLYGC